MKTITIYKRNRIVFAEMGFLVGLLVILSSCMGIKPGASKSGKKLYETFFVGEEGTQYFIKPLSFGNALKEEMDLDITFRYKKEVKDSAIVNMSFLNKEIFKNADSLSISNKSYSIVIREMNYLFSERRKEIYLSRFSTKVDLRDVKKLFMNTNWSMILYKNNNSSKFEALKTTQKNIGKLNYEVFGLF